MKPDVTPPSGRRRKVLQGTLAAPVVLTVSSASASSVSSFGRCLRNLDNKQSGKLFVDQRDASLDTWLRKEVEVVRFERHGEPAWFYFDRGRELYVRLADPTGPGISRFDIFKDWKKTGESKRWMLVWVDERSGKPSWRMQVKQPHGHTATTKSCYSSLMQRA